MLRGVLLLLLLLLSTCCGCSAFIGQAPSAWPNHGLMAADGGGTSQKKQLVVVVGETTRVYHGCWAPDSLTIEHPTDTRFFDVGNQPNRWSQSTNAHLTDPTPTHPNPHSATEAGAAPGTRLGCRGTSRRPNPRRAVPRIQTAARSSGAWRGRWRRPTRSW